MNSVSRSPIPECRLFRSDLRQLIIFDFDGTICDSFGESIRILNFLAPIFHFKSILGAGSSLFGKQKKLKKF